MTLPARAQGIRAVEAPQVMAGGLLPMSGRMLPGSAR